MLGSAFIGPVLILLLTVSLALRWSSAALIRLELGELFAIRNIAKQFLPFLIVVLSKTHDKKENY
jgi:fumarate reductase subunit D